MQFLLSIDWFKYGIYISEFLTHSLRLIISSKNSQKSKKNIKKFMVK